MYWEAVHDNDEWCRGGMIFTFFKAQGMNVGSSLVEEDKLDLARQLSETAKSKGVDIILPTDVVIADKFDANANSKVVPAGEIPDGWMVRSQSPSLCSILFWRSLSALQIVAQHLHHSLARYTAARVLCQQSVLTCVASIHLWCVAVLARLRQNDEAG